MEQLPPDHWSTPDELVLQIDEPLQWTSPRRFWLVHVPLFAATLLTTTDAGVRWLDLDPWREPTLLPLGLPFSLTLLAILLVHEAGHYLMCRRHGVEASMPYFLPAPAEIFPLGTFGAFIRIRMRFPDRIALFDIGAAGPWAGFVVAVLATILGLSWSTHGSAELNPNALRLGHSLLTASLTRFMLRAELDTVVLHPVALAGWFGLFVTSINLLPVGQLDGGHVLYALRGRSSWLVPALLLGALGGLGTHGWPGWIIWAVIITVLVRVGHPPTEEDHVPLGRGRAIAAILTFVIFVLTFVAEPFRIGQ